MSRFPELASRLKAVVQKRRLDREMAEELRHHLALRAERNLAGGMSVDEARVAALRQFGHIEGIKEQCREQRSLPWLDILLSDCRHAVRMLRQHPGFAAVTILTLAFGIGTTTAIFSVVNHVVLQPLPFPAADRLVSIAETLPSQPAPVPVSPAFFQAWRKQATLLQESALMGNWPAVVTGWGDPRRCFSRKVTPGYFAVMGVRPLLGRAFRPADGKVGAGDAVVLNYRFWLSQFQGRRDIIGRKLMVNDRPCTIVGVMPQSFLPETLTDPALFLPLVIETDIRPAYRGVHIFEAVARLKPNVTPAQVAQELTAIARRPTADYPGAGQDAGVRVVPLRDVQIGSVRPLLLTLLGAAGFLLVVVCVNVANLLVARASSRQKEMAVRLALGASRGRLIRQLLCESLLISFLGSTLGSLFAHATMKLMLALGPLALPRSKEIVLDGYAFAFATALTLIVGIGVGLVPALQAAGVNFTRMMKEGPPNASEGQRQLRLRNALVVCEVALALILLVGAGLLGRSFSRLGGVSLGFHPGVGVTFVGQPLLLEKRFPTAQRIFTLVDKVVARLSAVPGVEAVAFATTAPFCYGGWCTVRIEGQPAPDPATLPRVIRCAATAGYFKALRIPLLNGRLFNAGDTAAAPSVAVVSENFVRKYFRGDPIGKRFQVSGSEAWHEIVGVVADVKDRGPAEPTPLQFYLAYAQHASRSPQLLIRLDAEVPAARSALRAALDTVDPELPLPEMAHSLDAFLDDSIAAQRLAFFLFGVFSIAALVLSAIGIYGVVAYGVAQRTHEIGIRMALGAPARDILRLLFSQTGLWVGLGLALGIVGALMLPRWLRPLLFEMNAFDPLPLIGVVFLLGAVACAACWIPGRRAMKVDPMVALREE